MFSFFRKKGPSLTPTQLAAALLLASVWDEEKDRSAIPEGLDSLKKELIREVQLLRCFTTVYAVSVKLGQSSEKEALIDAFYRYIQEPVVAPHPLRVTPADLELRGLGYAQAVNTSHNLGSHYLVGKEFACWVGRPDDLALIMCGTIQFASWCVFVDGALGKAGYLK